MTSTTSRLAAFIALATVAVGALAQATRDSLTIRASQALPEAAQRVLAALTTPVPRPVAADVDPFDTLRSHCGGSFSNDYYEQVKKANSGFVFTATAQPRTLSLPACPKIWKNTTTTVLKGEDLAALLERTLGVRPDDVISVCDDSAGTPRSRTFDTCRLTAKKALAALNGAGRSGLDHLDTGRVLAMPTLSQPTTIALKPGVSASAAISQLRAVMQTASATTTKAIVTITPPTHLQLEPLLKPDDSLLAGTACESVGPPPVDWPFNAVRLQQAIERSRAFATARHIRLTQTVIRVADTGAIGIGSYFPTASLAQNTWEQAHQNQDLDKNGWVGDRYGINAESEGRIEPFDDDPFKTHGTQVADAALGGLALRTAYPAIYDLLNVSFAKIFWRGTGPLSVNDGVLLEAMQPISHHQMPSVINFSVGADNENDTRTFVDTVADARKYNYLAVIAAGNDRQDLGAQPMYPAAYGGSSVAGAWILSVGASGPDGLLANFSNYSRNRVDMLAPGCRISSTGPDGSVSILNGTSIAAPMASAAAGSVHALGVDSMIDAKQRLIASGDYNPALASVTRSGTVLNFERAVSLYQDSLRLAGEREDHRGTWQRPDGELLACKGVPPLNPIWVLSIASYAAGGVQRLHILMRDAVAMSGSPLDCDAAPGGPVFIDADGSTHQVDWAKVAALVPAYPFPTMQP